MIKKLMLCAIILIFASQVDYSFARNRKPPVKEMATPGTGFNITRYPKIPPIFPEPGST